MDGSQNIINNNSNFANQTGVNQMNQIMMNSSEYKNSNNLFNQNVQNTWQCMLPNNFVNQTNLNNKTNILSLINVPIIVPYHSNHPLISCQTIGRAELSPSWKCNVCGSDYSYNVPTFYCTACDFDLCQRCLLYLSAFAISLYNYSSNSMNQIQQFTNNLLFFKNIHQHPIVKIVRDQTYAEVCLKCNSCFKVLQKDEPFHYCSLCNYCICLNCFQKNTISNQFVNNPEYLAGDQMNVNNN